MKKIAILLSIFMASIFCEPVLAVGLNKPAAVEIGGGYKIKKHRKFKTHKKRRRGLRTCLNKNGCKKHKLLKTKHKSCNTY